MSNSIHAIVSYLDKNHTAFAVSRLIMLSGVPVRRYGVDAPEDDGARRRVLVALRQMFTEREVATLLAELKMSV